MQEIIHGDCLEVMKKMPDNSVDSIVTDPPYGISFMGKKWDYDVPKVEVWHEAMRVLKPGGHILVACGTRTQHRMAVNIEDAGFEIRDIVAWIYGSGFPKSLNIGKAVDKLQGNEREVIGKIAQPGSTNNRIAMGNGWQEEPDLTKGSSPWEGWGTALKPAMELWTLARKPLSEKTVAENVLRWGTGGLNIDESRVGTEVISQHGRNSNDNPAQVPQNEYKPNNSWTGRFPANIIHDNSEEVRECFPNESERFFKSIIYTAKASKSERNKGLEGMEEQQTVGGGGGIGDYLSDVNSASGKFGSEKAPAKNNHPTVKPISLMKYLIKLVTPKGGTVLDPFVGSGSTAVAAKELGFQCIGIEREEEYCEIARKRLEETQMPII